MAMLHMYCGLVGLVRLHAPEGHLITVLPTLVEVVQIVIHERTGWTISVQPSSAKRKLRLQCFSEPLPSLTSCFIKPFIKSKLIILFATMYPPFLQADTRVRVYAARKGFIGM